MNLGNRADQMEERITDTEDRNLEISQMEKESRAKKKRKKERTL